jgi:hypothetical protein
MQVQEALSFDDYWGDPRFAHKKPELRGSLKRAFGDNIYHRSNGEFLQLDSHHSLPDGSANQRNILNDTKADRVLVAILYAYWGSSAPAIPQSLRSYKGHDLCIGRGYKRHFPAGLEQEFVSWFHRLGVRGCVGRPADWL